MCYLNAEYAVKGNIDAPPTSTKVFLQFHCHCWALALISAEFHSMNKDILI